MVQRVLEDWRLHGDSHRQKEGRQKVKMVGTVGVRRGHSGSTGPRQTSMASIGVAQHGRYPRVGEP